MSKKIHLNPFEHARKRPENYIGSTVTSSSEQWIIKNGEETAVLERIRFNQGLFNIVREILSNAIDNVWRSKEKKSKNLVKKIEIGVDSISGEIYVWNDGFCIPVHKIESEYTDHRTGKTVTEQRYPAELYFGEFLAGTNYDDEETRKTSGKNGMGASAANAFSTKFRVECANPDDKEKFVQEYSNGGMTRNEPQITKFRNSKGYTLITFTPDYKYFKYPSLDSQGIDDEFISILRLYAHEVAMITGVLVKFVLNEESSSIKIPSLEKYARLFYPDAVENKMTSIIAPNGDECVIMENDLPEMDALENIPQISFVNGVKTKNGGIHTDGWRDAIIPSVVRTFNGRKNKEKIKASAKEIYPYLTLFIRVEVDKPQFDSATKDRFDGTIEIIDKDGEKTKILNDDYKLFNARSKPQKEEWNRTLEVVVKKMLKWNFVFLLEEKILAKLDRAMTKKEGTAKSKVSDPKIHDANKAGGKESHKCTGIITEGDSAKTLAITGISSLEKGQDYNGVMSIKGKFINVQNASTRQVNNNEEIQRVKKFYGLRHGLDYSIDENFKTLRYGKAYIMADADDDGIHICGLLLNFFYRFYPELIKRGYVESLSTPVAAAIFKGASKVKKNKGNLTNPAKLLFYSNPEFRKWYFSDESKQKKIEEIEYIKGLGSIDRKDASIYFREKKVVSFFIEGDEDDIMDLGFSEKRADSRKEWITRDMIKKRECEDEEDEEDELVLDLDSEEKPDENELILENEEDNDKRGNLVVLGTLDQPDFVYDGKLGLSSFVNRHLIIYHKMALRRALPCVWDGLKESQRKILFTAIVKDYKKVRDLEKFTGAVKETAGYHHGSASLYEASVKMAQGFTGSNNIPLLVDKGMYGSRLCGGKDHAAPRYLKTMMEKITRVIFSAEDDPLLEKLIVDDEEAEYNFFMPILPMILVNGSKGVASGYSTDIPCYNPLEIVKWIEEWLNGDTSCVPELIPWYRDYGGKIELIKNKAGKAYQWKSTGILEKGTGAEKGWWHIRDLPIGLWTDTFKMWLEFMETNTIPKGKKWTKKENKCLADIKSYCGPNNVHFMIKPTKDFIPDIETSGNLSIMIKRKSLKNIVAIDENNYPHRFSSPEAILKFFCPTRLEYYGLRKSHILKVLRHDLMKATNKYRFAKAVKDKKLDLHKEDEDLIEVLGNETWKFDKLPHGSEKKLTFDYLLNMQMRSMTVKRLEELKKEADKLRREIGILEGKSSKDLWREDLEKFKKVYKEFIIERKIE